MANGNDETKQDTTQQANPDPLGVFGDNPPKPAQKKSSGAKPDPLGVFASTKSEPQDDAGAAKADSILQGVHEQLERMQKDRPPLKFKQPEEGAPDNELLQEANEELGLNSDIPFPQLPNSQFNSAQAVSTGVAPRLEGQQRVDINEATKRVSSIIDGYDEEPIEKRRRMVQEVQGVFNQAIEQSKEEGDEKHASKLEGELENIKELERFLFERESEEYERNTNFFTETKNQLKKGALGMMLSYNGRAIADTEMLSIYDQIDKTGEMPAGVSDSDSKSEFAGVGKWAEAREYFEAEPEEREQIKAARLEQLAIDIADIKDLRKSIQSIPTHPKAEKFLTATSFGEAFDAFLNAPWVATTEVAFANLPQMTTTLAAGALGSIGGPAGAAAASGSASKFMEYGNLILEELAREGVDLEKEEEIMKAVQDEELMKKVRKRAHTGSSIVGLLDGAAFGLAATRFIPKGTVDDIAGYIGREALDETIQVTGQGFLGGSGAALSELARTGEITNYGEISAEAVGEGAFAPLRAFGVRRSIRMMKTARARHSVAEYITTDEILNKIKAERRKAVREENEGRVAAADRLMASIRERRGKMVNEQRERLAERRDDLEQKIAKMEEKHGSKAFKRDSFKMALQERDAINKMLEGEQILTEQTQQTDGTTQQTEQTQGDNQQGTQREATETQAQEAQETGQESGQAQPERTEGQPSEQGAESGVEVPELQEDNSNLHEVYAAENGIDPESIDELGSGERGTAYATGDGRVIKITSSETEAKLAEQRKGKETSGLANVYDVQRRGDQYIILQEELEIDSDVEDSFFQAQEVFQDQDLSVAEAHMFDPDDVSEDMQSVYEDNQEFVDQLADISNEYRRMGIMASDIQPDNLGVDQDGNLKAFDIDQIGDGGRFGVNVEGVEIQEFNPQQQQQADPTQRLQERLEGVQRDIEQMESLDNPTETDSEYLMWLRDEQERLQARISNVQQQRQQEQQQQTREESVDRYLLPEDAESGPMSDPTNQQAATELNEGYREAWDNEGKYVKNNRGDYFVRSGNHLFQIEKNADGQWVSNEVNGELEVTDTFDTRKEAKQATDSVVESWQKADTEAKINSQKLKEQGMDEAAEQVVDESAGVEREHESIQIDENTYNYRGHLVRKAEDGNKWEIIKNGNVMTSASSFQAAMEGVNSIIDGQVNTTTGQELGTPTKAENLNGAELPKGTLTTANKEGDQVYVGGLLDNHGIIADKHNNDPEATERGFITPDGRFLTRSEAAEYTRQESIETDQGGGPSDILLSEQLTKQREKADGTNESKEYKQNTNVREQAAEDVKNKLKVDISNWGNSNRIVTQEQANEIRSDLYSGLGQLNMGIDPKALANAAKLATYHMEAGVRAFSDFAAVMIDEVGKQVVPHLRDLYDRAKNDVLFNDIEDMNIDETEFSDKPEVDRWFLDYHKRDEETFTPEEATSYVAETTNLVDEEIKSQLQHHALTELAKAYHNRSTDVNNILEFMDAVRDQFPDQFSRGDMRSAWSSALSDAEERRRFWTPAKISESTGIPLRHISFFSDVGILMRKKLQDSFIGQKRVQREIKELRGEDYFNKNERLDAYLQEELIRGRVSELQWEVTSMQNPNSTIRQILQVAKENNLKIGEWKEYYATMQKARRARKAGNEENAVQLEKEALEMKPNENDEVQQYLHAKHAEEANNFLVEQIEKEIEGYELQLEQIPDTPENKQQRAAIKGQITRLKNQVPEAKRGSGMTNEEAQRILTKFDEEGKTEALQGIAEKVYEINETMLEMRRNNGLNSDQEIDEYQARFNNYVPLDRMMFDPYGNLLDEVGTSTKSGGVRGADFKKRTGSDRPVDNILGTTMMNYDQLIGDIERNNLVATLASLYDSEWAMGNEQYGRSVRAESAEDVDSANSIQYRKRNSDGSVEDRVLIFNSGSELVFDAIENMGTNHNSTTIKTVINGLRSFTNYLRFMRTSASMNFIFSNPQRDIGVVMGNMASDFGYGASLKFAKNIFHDKSRFVDAQRSIWEYMRGEDTPGAAQYRELKEMGGTTGFYQLSDRADILKRMRKVEKEIQDQMMREDQPVRNTKKRIKNAFRGIIRGVEGMNEIAENATRLTAYRMALENGYSKRRAASYALNINTNFNRSGDWGDLFKIGYQFANSAIQGHTRMAQAAKVNPKTFMKTATALMTLGAANASFNDWMNEEAHERLRKTRPWLFNNNLVFLSPEGDVMFKIYLPFGYNVFKAAGDVVHDLAKGRVDADQAAVDMGNAVADSFNPFRGAQMFNGGVQGLMMAATPTVAEPFTEIALNKSFFGNIYPPFRHALQEQLDINDFQLKYDSVNPYMEYTTNFLAKHDLADISPETIEHMSYFLGGSVGREWINLFSKSINTDEAKREGFTLYTKADGTEVKIMPNNIPVVSRFLNTVDEDRTAAASIYKTAGEMSRKSLDVRGDEFRDVLDNLESDYEVLLENDATPEGDREVMQKTMNAFVKTVFKNNMRDKTVEAFRESDMTGAENEAARRRYYERINRQVRRFRIPQLDRTDRANFRLLPYGTKRSKIFDENLIEQVEVKVNDITATAD